MVDRELSQLQSSINLMNKKILSLECEVEKEIEEKNSLSYMISTVHLITLRQRKQKF